MGGCGCTIISASGCALLPVPVAWVVPAAHLFRFRLCITSGSGCAINSGSLAQHFRFRIRIPSGSYCALLPVPVAQKFPVPVAQ